MKTAKKRVKVSFALALVLFAMILSIFLPILSYADADYNFTAVDSQYIGSMNSADLLEYLLGEEIGTEERAYLVKYGDVCMSYDEGITTSLVFAHLNGEALEILAKEYSYSSSGGGLITWVPTSVALGEESLDFTKNGRTGEYYAEFSTVLDSSLESVRVMYSLVLYLDADDATALLNKAKNDIPKIEAEIKEKNELYEAARASYLEAKSEYEQYLYLLSEYEEDKRLYDEYVLKYRVYKEALDAYEEYLADLAVYNASVAAYDKYLLDMEQYEADYLSYLDYLEQHKEYLLRLDEYENYLSTVDSFRSRLEIMEYTTIKMTSLRRSLYNAVFGTMVDTVLKERAALEANNVGAPPGVIDLAGESTENLRTLLGDYFSFETETAKYDYYCENYDAIKKNFADLFASLDYLYSIPAVRSYIYRMDREEKYRILLAQLYVVSTALSDTPVKSVAPEYVVGGKDEKTYKQFSYTSSYSIDIQYYTPKDILGEENILADTNSAYPIFQPFPTEVSEPVEPTPVSEPIKPDMVSLLDKPAELSHPGDEPVRVEAPGDEPAAVSPPPEEPQPYVAPDEYSALISVKDSVAERNSCFTDPVAVTVVKSVEKKFKNVEEVTVKFYSERKKLLYEETVDKGTPVVYRGPVQKKTEDERAVYTFVGWQNENGERIDLSAVSGDVIAYPLFSEDVKSYDVTFSVDGVAIVQHFKYGDTPVYSGTPTKNDDGVYSYEFSHWDRDFAPVTKSATYTAVFEKKYLMPIGIGGAEISYDGTDYVANLRGALVSTIDISYLLERAYNFSGVKIRGYNEYYLSLSTVNKLKEAGACAFFVRVTDKEGEALAYDFSVLDANGEAIDGVFPIKVTSGVSGFEKNERLKLFTDKSGTERVYHKFTYDGQYLSFTLQEQQSYVFAYEYRVSAIASDNLSLTIDKRIYTAGEQVNVSFTVPVGIRVTRVSCIDENGDPVPYNNSGFVMPCGDVTFSVETERLRYKISFVNDGRVMQSTYCYYGDYPLVPESPKKSGDGEYTYSFVGWSEEIVPATADKTYTAVYEAREVEQKVDTDTGLGIYMSANLFMLVLLGVLALLIVGAALLVIKRLII